MGISPESKVCSKRTPGGEDFSMPVFRQLLAQRLLAKRQLGPIPKLTADKPRESSPVPEYTLRASLDATARAVLKYPFKKVCRLLLKLDEEEDHDLISETLLHFSLKIYGLPECPIEDLPLAVYFFIEDTFGIQSKIELCVRLYEDGHSNVIGVVFGTIYMKYFILRNHVLSGDTEVRLRNNEALDWIVDGFCGN